MKDPYEGLPFEVLRVSPQLEIRKFDHSVNPDEMKWHRDAEDRIFRLVSGHGWLFQLDNQLPVPIKLNESYFIPAGMWHRAIKTPGAEDLVIQLHKRV